MYPSEGSRDTIELLMRHRSIRAFADEKTPPEALEAIVRAAQMASTSSNVQ
ncbi:nitroreductase family protein, partial [Acinetobacter baumannii]